MNKKQLERMAKDEGFIAALDQSGGSTPKTLTNYGLDENAYEGEEQMYELVHEMRTRVMQSPSFSSKYILGAILFEDTINRMVGDKLTPDFLWEEKGIVPFLKIDKGLDEFKDGVQLMKPIDNLTEFLNQAVSKNIFGTKMRSFIKEANQQGIHNVVAQQFEIAKQIWATGLVPIIEPEIDIESPQKAEAEKILKQEIMDQLSLLDPDVKVMLKITIPSEDNFYEDLMNDKHIIRIVALSGGYAQKDANEKLAKNKGLIASFSRTLLFGLKFNQTPEEFDETLINSIKGIYEASTSKG